MDSALGLTYFWLCAAMALIGAVATVANKNPIRGAMGLLLLILSVAGLFFALHAQFLAVIQLIVYAGAIVVLSAILFTVGGVGFLVRRNVLVTLMSIEVMLNAVNLALVAFNRSWITHPLQPGAESGTHTGQVFAFFIIAAEAAEVAVGLAIVLALYRLKRTVRSDEADLLKN